MAKRTPRNYEGIIPTGKPIAELLPAILRKMGHAFEIRADLILAAWADVIGEKMAPMTQAVSFQEGILTVKVKNSTLLSLLTQHEKPRLLQSLREKFPTVKFMNINFRMG